MNKKYINDTLKLRDVIEGAFVALGERFYNIRTQNHWKGLYESYEEFLEDMRVSKGNASKMESVYRTYVIEHKIPPERLTPAGWSTLYQAIPLLNKYNVEEVIEKATTLLRSHIHDEVRELKAGPHECNWEQITIRTCTICQKRERVS